ncbi:MAG: hypothetical protein EXS36_19035 [Pedosphaera sp.]|nr:hypothetical protein [Pedosphaera sp.]
MASALPRDEAVGQTLGRYKLLEKVGENGCGVVYVAEQTKPVRRRDIYSLSVLLYELPTGDTPVDAKELMASGIDSMQKTIRERELAALCGRHRGVSRSGGGWGGHVRGTLSRRAKEG